VQLAASVLSWSASVKSTGSGAHIATAWQSGSAQSGLPSQSSSRPLKQFSGDGQHALPSTHMPLHFLAVGAQSVLEHVPAWQT
jgi:hypothetical protein